MLAPSGEFCQIRAVGRISKNFARKFLREKIYRQVALPHMSNWPLNFRTKCINFVYHVSPKSIFFAERETNFEKNLMRLVREPLMRVVRETKDNFHAGCSRGVTITIYITAWVSLPKMNGALGYSTRWISCFAPRCAVRLKVRFVWPDQNAPGWSDSIPATLALDLKAKRRKCLSACPSLLFNDAIQYVFSQYVF